MSRASLSSAARYIRNECLRRWRRIVDKVPAQRADWLLVAQNTLECTAIRECTRRFMDTCRLWMHPRCMRFAQRARTAPFDAAVDVWCFRWLYNGDFIKLILPRASLLLRERRRKARLLSCTCNICEKRDNNISKIFL